MPHREPPIGAHRVRVPPPDVPDPGGVTGHDLRGARVEREADAGRADVLVKRAGGNLNDLRARGCSGE